MKLNITDGNMYRPIAPDIQKWYQDIDRNDMFRVIAESVTDDSVEIQYFSGELAALDFDTWFALHLRVIPPPEDSSGPFELSQEELGYDSDNSRETSSNPLSDLGLYEHDSSYDNYDIDEKYDKYFDKKYFFER